MPSDGPLGIGRLPWFMEGVPAKQLTFIGTLSRLSTRGPHDRTSDVATHAKQSECWHTSSCPVVTVPTCIGTQADPEASPKAHATHDIELLPAFY